MSDQNESEDQSRKHSGLFPQTRWSLILRANEDQSQIAHEALSTLCQLYWYPVYCMVRSRGCSPEDAEDLCQSFFQQLLSRRLFERAEVRKGKLRSFILNALKDHLTDNQRRSNTKKRGGGVKPLSLDQAEAEQRYSIEPIDELTPDALFDRAWANSIITRALTELEENYAHEGKRDFFSKIQVYMSGNDADGHAQLAAQLDMNPNTLRVAVHRMRKRFRVILEKLIAETVDTQEDFSNEIRHLLSLFSS